MEKPLSIEFFRVLRIILREFELVILTGKEIQRRGGPVNFEDGPFGRPLQKQSYIRDERLDILEKFKEIHGHEALLEVLQASHELRNHVNIYDGNGSHNQGWRP